MNETIMIGVDKADAPDVTVYVCSMHGCPQIGTGTTPEDAFLSFIGQRIFRLRFAWNTLTPPNRSAPQ